MWYTFPMVHPNIRFIRAVGTMVGSVVGVGVFGLPYAFVQSGPALGALVLLAIAALLGTLQLMYAEVALHVPGSHRLVGYTRQVLGERWARFSILALSAAQWGAMLAFLIVGGKFLFTLLSPVFGGTEVVYAMLMAVLAATLLVRGIQFVARVEIGVIGAVLFLFAFITLAALPHARLAHLAGVHWNAVLIPYGVALFALSGVGIIPEMKAVLGARQHMQLPRAVVLGTALITALYLIFALVVSAALGARTTEVAFEGLVPLLGGSFAVVTSLLGSVTVLSIFTMTGIELTNAFRYDLRLSPRMAVACAVAFPVLLYLVGVRELIGVLMFVGSVFGGTVAVLIVVLYERVRSGALPHPHRCLNLPSALSWGVVVIFVSGIILTVVQFISTL